MILLSIKLHNIIQEFTNKTFQILPSFKWSFTFAAAANCLQVLLVSRLKMCT